MNTPTENLFTPGKIRTFTGRYVNPLVLEAEDIDIRDIAHALANTCRWGGHCSQFYSVAQHCVEGVFRLKETVHKKAFLIHDATETYLLDLPRPVKECLPGYRNIEYAINHLICRRFGISSWLYEEEVKAMDNQLLQLEWEQLVIGTHRHGIDPWQPSFAEKIFLDNFNRLFS